MKNITHLLRVKKNNPIYELYEVKDNKVSFLKGTNNLININLDNLFLRIVLSTSLCVEGERLFEEKRKQFKVTNDQFYFNHQIISNEKDLVFSKPKAFQNKLRQLWMNKDEYNKLIVPIIEKYNKKLESIISEKSSFIVNQNQVIKLFDGKNLSLLKLNEKGLNEISIGQNGQNINNNCFNGLLLNTEARNSPNLKTDELKINFLAHLSLFLFFLMINIFIFYVNNNPIYSLKINYFLTELKINKIKNPDKVIELEKLLKINLKTPPPEKFNLFNNFINLFPDELLSKILESELSENRIVKLKFDSNAMKEVLNFTNNNKGLNVKIETFDTFILLIKEL